MAATTSPTSARRYGVARVCRIWDVPRSSFYADRRRADTTTTPVPAQRRGPKPRVSDDALLAAIRADLARSPWHGEGHRKVWARLRVMDGVRVARKRVLRLMRANALLSPHRSRPRDDTPHDRKIITEAPNIMWATDGTQIITVQDGKVWLFGVIEHWNAETLGWHVAKRGDATPPSRPSAWRFAMSSATSAPARLAASRCDTTTAARSSPNISTTRSASGA